MKRREFTREDRAAMLRRARDENGIVRCEGCGCDLTGKRFEFDHTLAEGLILDKRRKLTPEDGKLLGKACCHRGEDGKTARDVAVIAKAKRVEAKLNGIRPQSRLQGRGFRKAPPQHRATAPLAKWNPWALNSAPGRGED